MEEQERHRIKGHTAALLTSVAVFFDLFQMVVAGLIGIAFSAIPFVNVVLGPTAVVAIIPLFNFIVSGTAFIIFTIWFAILDIRVFGTAKKAVTTIGLRLSEFVPYLGFIPGWSISTMLIIKYTRHEDKEYNKNTRREDVFKKNPNRARKGLRGAKAAVKLVT